MSKCCEITKLPSTGNSFSWGGMRYYLWIQCKLDRSFENKQWFQQFPVSNQTFLEKRRSDLRSILISLISSKEAYRDNFIFDRRFLNKPLVKKIIIESWNLGKRGRNGSVSGSDRIRAIKKALNKWKKGNNLNFVDKIKQLQIALELEQSRNMPCFQNIRIIKK